MTPPSALLFDLDETLLDTSALREARGTDWNFVSNNLDSVGLYAGHPERLLPRLRAEGIKVGVVTRSPRWYAESLVSKFGLVMDVLVTGSDGYTAKPDPSALLAAAEELGVSPSDIAHVGDDADDHHAAARAGMFSIGATWALEGGRAEAWHRHWPDLTLKGPDAIMQPESWPTKALAAEVSLDGSAPSIHWGSVIPLGDGMSLGRYFDTKDRRAAQHKLSAAILSNKHSHRDAEALGEAVASVLRKLKTRLGGSIVTSVPGHEGEEFDRFLHVREAAAAALGGEDRAGILTEKRRIDNYKGLGPEDRKAANEDRFQASDVDAGRSIVLIDDVFTFGDTLRSCQSALLRAGASRAYGLCLAHTQDSILENCPECGRPLRLIDGRRGRFIGCTGWWIDQCPYTRDIDDS